MLYFHQVQFWLYSYSCHISAPPTYSQLNSAQVLYPYCYSSYIYSFMSSLIVLHIFLLSPFHSSFWPHPVLFFDHSLFLAYLLIILILCMWISFACDFFMPCYILPFPFLTIACSTLPSPTVHTFQADPSGMVGIWPNSDQILTSVQAKKKTKEGQIWILVIPSHS